jgi:hypothetical protein
MYNKQYKKTRKAYCVEDSQITENTSISSTPTELPWSVLAFLITHLHVYSLQLLFQIAGSNRRCVTSMQIKKSRLRENMQICDTHHFSVHVT